MSSRTKEKHRIEVEPGVDATVELTDDGEIWVWLNGVAVFLNKAQWQELSIFVDRNIGQLENEEILSAED